MLYRMRPPILWWRTCVKSTLIWRELMTQAIRQRRAFKHWGRNQVINCRHCRSILSGRKRFRSLRWLSQGMLGISHQELKLENWMLWLHRRWERDHRISLAQNRLIVTLWEQETQAETTNCYTMTLLPAIHRHTYMIDSRPWKASTPVAQSKMVWKQANFKTNMASPNTQQKTP